MTMLTLADIAKLEQTPVWERISEQSVYESLQQIARRRPDHAAFLAVMSADPAEQPRRLSYGEFFRQITQAANLYTSLGVGPESVVSLLLSQVPEAFTALLGAMTAGIANPLNFLLEPEHLIAITREAGTTVLVASGESLSPDTWARVEMVRAACPNLKAVVRIGGSGTPPPGVIDFETALLAQPADHLIAEQPASRDKTVALFHTGGTTGKPKLARHTNGGLLVTAWTNALVTTEGGEEEIFFTGLPLFHIGGAVILGLTRLLSGQTIVLLTPLGVRNPAVLRNYWTLVERFKITAIGGVPTTLAALLNLPGEPLAGSRVRSFYSGAAALPVEIAQRFTERFGLPVLEGYGMTEVYGYSTMNPGDGQWRYGSVGRRVPYMEIIAADVSPEGVIRRRCDPDEIGHVLMRGPQVFAGYLDPDNNRGTLLADGWLDSGDLGRVDADGYVWLTGRAKDLIIRGGHNIDPALIEQALSRHPAVALAAAVGCPDSYAGELPVAFVQLKKDQATTEAELLAFCRTHITERAAAPVEIFIIPAIPLTAMGKIHKVPLRMEAARCVFTRALSQLTEIGVKAQVEMVDHPRHGCLARIRIEHSGALDSAALQSRCSSLFGGYQLRYEVVLPPQEVQDAT